MIRRHRGPHPASAGARARRVTDREHVHVVGHAQVVVQAAALLLHPYVVGDAVGQSAGREGDGDHRDNGHLSGHVGDVLKVKYLIYTVVGCDYRGDLVLVERSDRPDLVRPQAGTVGVPGQRQRVLRHHARGGGQALRPGDPRGGHGGRALHVEEDPTGDDEPVAHDRNGGVDYRHREGRRRCPCGDLLIRYGRIVDVRREVGFRCVVRGPADDVHRIRRRVRGHPRIDQGVRKSRLHRPGSDGSRRGVPRRRVDGGLDDGRRPVDVDSADVAQRVGRHDETTGQERLGQSRRRHGRADRRAPGVGDHRDDGRRVSVARVHATGEDHVRIALRHLRSAQAAGRAGSRRGPGDALPLAVEQGVAREGGQGIARVLVERNQGARPCHAFDEAQLVDPGRGEHGLVDEGTRRPRRVGAEGDHQIRAIAHREQGQGDAADHRSAHGERLVQVQGAGLVEPGGAAGAGRRDDGVAQIDLRARMRTEQLVDPPRVHRGARVHRQPVAHGLPGRCGGGRHLLP